MKLEKRIHVSLSKVFDFDFGSVINKPKIGLAFVENREVNPTKLVRMAITAMEDARKSYGNLAIYSKAGEDKIRRRLKLIYDFPKALARGDFFLVYQPKVTCRSGRFYGVEALVRWNNKKTESISPSEFIPIIEDTEFIFKLTEWVISQVLRDIDYWQGLGLKIKVSINVSVKDFERKDWVNLLKANQRLMKNADLICFELTETAAISNIRKINQVINQLKTIGLKTHIDDFGTGHSNLSHLSKMDVSAIKLDRQFIQSISSSERDLAIVKHTCSLAKALGFELIAEGVETLEDKKILESFGVNYIQGYFIARPMMARDFLEWVKKR
ncbi:EAL domain-containing protein [Kangiella sp. TOML190]|uniref:EAL domain-containing protein n=1 Tax=Kangiella sp. TOML190 TaxID=2931351 RepID=UPI002040395D|nr:EAL domain-containing protein [Kangiella sp. TOML190]